MLQNLPGSYASLNGLELYYEIFGSGRPLILLHGGLGVNTMFGPVLSQLADCFQVIAVELQAHGHTADIDRPIRYELMADDIAALIQHLSLDRVNLMGFSLGGGVALRTAIQHPEMVAKLVLVSTPFKRQGWYPDVLAGMNQLSGAAAESMKPSPMYQAYVRIAPRPENFPALLDKMGDLMRQPYDWSEEVAALKTPTLLVFGDADSVPPSHAAEFFALLGGGLQDAGWDNAKMPTSHLAILPGKTHYNICYDLALGAAVCHFLNRAQLE